MCHLGLHALMGWMRPSEMSYRESGRHTERTHLAAAAEKLPLSPPLQTSGTVAVETEEGNAYIIGRNQWKSQLGQRHIWMSP